ncbi:hypothetical protein KF840_08730 [bacterium]|nr:hypothetical protein [bacterium]
MIPGPSDPPPPRSAFVSGLAWTIIGASALLVPISVISLLMILAGSYGTASTDVLGFLAVVVAPPAALAAGIGLLGRRTWAWYGVVALLVALMLANAYELLTARDATTTHRSPAGVETTVLASEPNHHSLPIIVVCAFVLAALGSRAVRAELGVGRRPRATAAPTAPAPGNAPARPPRGWRVGHRGRDGLYYEERHWGVWRRIDIDGEMLTGRAHHVVYFASPERWQRYPAWARGRRDAIIARIKSELGPPEYEYGDGGPAATAGAAPRPHHDAARQRTALLLAVALLLALSAGAGWMVRRGVERGATWLPAPRVTQQRPVSRAQEPATFWLAIGVYALVSVGSGGLALWGLRAGWRG